MKKLFCLAFSFFSLHISLNAQEYYVRNNYKDTIPCSQMEYFTNSQGFIVELTYLDKDGKKVTREGKKALKDVQVIKYANAIVERMPLKASKPDSYVRYGERKVNGKLQVLVYNDLHQTTDWIKNPANSKLDGYKTTTRGTYLFYLKMPGGTYLNANKNKVIKKIIKPYLMACPEFAEQYKGKFSREEKKFIEMIQLYNSFCKK